MNYFELFNELFNKKIDSFLGCQNYEILKKKADEVNCSHSFGLENILYTDFMERIIAMPIEYIQDWLDGKNQLEWRDSDKKMLAAIKGGWVDVIEKYPNAEIRRISESAIDFYEEYGYKILVSSNSESELRILAIKEE